MTNTTEKFKCTSCGTSWTATEDEYFYAFSSYFSTETVCQCPSCNRIVRKTPRAGSSVYSETCMTFCNSCANEHADPNPFNWTFCTHQLECRFDGYKHYIRRVEDEQTN